MDERLRGFVTTREDMDTVEVGSSQRGGPGWECSFAQRSTGWDGEAQHTAVGVSQVERGPVVGPATDVAHGDADDVAATSR